MATRAKSFSSAVISKAERDCSVGASLTTKPRYRWTVDGEELG